MASIPGVRFDISGASGSQGLLSPKSGWFVYVLPRGGYASQDSTGATITFDSATIASRFATNNWVQVGTDTSKLRKVSGVGGNSITVAGAVVVVTENDRIFCIGNTQPSVTGGSATYIIPQTIIRQRDDDAADIYTNSMVTTNSNGLVQFFSNPAIYDAIIQDGNQSNQGSIIDMAIGVVEGISTDQAVIFGGTLTVNGTMGVTGWATFGSTVTMNAVLGVTGWATFGASVTITGALGVTGTGHFGSTLTAGANFNVTGNAIFGQTTTIVGTSGNYSHTGTAKFGDTVTITGALGVTGAVTLGSTVNVSSIQGTSDINARRFVINRSHTVGSTYFVLNGWGSTASVTVTAGSVDQGGQFYIAVGGTTYASNPNINHQVRDGNWPGVGSIGPQGVMIGCRSSPTLIPVAIYDSGSGDLGKTWICGITATHGEVYQFNYIYFGTSSL